MMLLYLLKFMFRNRVMFYWSYAFSIMLLLIFGPLWSSSSPQSLNYTVYVGGSSPFEQVVVNALNSSGFIIKEVNVTSPATYANRIGADEALVYFNYSGVAVYAKSYIVAQVVGGVVEGIMWNILNPHVVAPNVTTVILGGGKTIYGGPAALSLSLFLVLFIYAAVTALSLMGVLRSTGYVKRMYLSQMSKAKLAVSILGASLIFELGAAAMLVLVARAIMDVNISLFVNPAVWISATINFLFVSGLVLLIDRLNLSLSRSPEELSFAGVPLFMVLSFLSGYFAPIELYPEPVRSMLLQLPTAQTLQLAQSGVSGAINWAGYAVPALVSLVVLAAGLSVFQLYKRP